MRFAGDDGGDGQVTIAVDFDGVIHAYSKGWHDGTIYDEPVFGAFEALWALSVKGFGLVIFTARPQLSSEISEWIRMKGVEAVARGEIPFMFAFSVTKTKPIASLYIDDRAYRFTNWDDATDFVNSQIEGD